jgi:hypothetical protein|tara:strand:- start:279 stop:1013 length:735 start_codon:yes stop_codon:yes gene_type:complete
MINKLQLQSVISKYYLNVNESVKWETTDNNLSIDFMSPTKDVIGKVQCSNFELEDSVLAIYDTKKLSSLISICNGDLLLELEKTNKIFTKLKISDLNFNLTYALSDALLIGKVGTVNIPEFVVKLNLTSEDIDNLIKAKSALSQVDNMLVTTTTNLDGENVCEFIFGDESGHNNKITYQVAGEISEQNLKIPFNSDTFKTILHANKDMEGGTLNISTMGLMEIKFQSDDIQSEYYMVRKAETEF